LQKTIEADRSRGGISRYTQIAGSLRAQIEAGDWPIGAALPSIQKLALNFAAAPETVRQALAVLEDEGLVRRKQGVGTIVIATPRDMRWLALPTDWEGFVSFLDKLEVRRLLIEASERAPRLWPDEGTPLPAYKYLKRVHSRRDEPFCVLSAYLSAEIYIRKPRDFRENVIVPMLAHMDGIEIGKVRQSLRFDVADMELAQLLAIPVAAPIVWVRRTICDTAGNVIYLADVAYRGDVVTLEMELSPKAGADR
jgi:GntR family transcriptional regulator